jgi:hypothetical protein
MNTEPLQDRTRAAIEWARAHQQNNNPTDIHAVNQTLLAFQFNQLLEAIGFDKIKSEFEKSPKDYLDLTRTVLEQSSERTKRMKVELELETYRDQVAEQKRKVEDALNKPELQKGLSPEALQQIEEAMAHL